MPLRIGISGLLVRKTRNRIAFNVRASAKSYRIIRISSLPSYSSKASMTTVYDRYMLLPSSLDNGRRTSQRYQSQRDQLAMSLCSIIASQICSRRDSTVFASYTAILVKNLRAWLTSLPPIKKKKLAPRRFQLKYLRATVRAIVDFPMPAKPFSQKIYRSSCPSAHLYIFYRRSTRVSRRQVALYQLSCELNGAPIANQRRLNKLS